MSANSSLMIIWLVLLSAERYLTLRSSFQRMRRDGLEIRFTTRSNNPGRLALWAPASCAADRDDGNDRAILVQRDEMSLARPDDLWRRRPQPAYHGPRARHSPS